MSGQWMGDNKVVLEHGFADDEFEEKFMKWLNSKTKDDIIKDLSKYTEENKFTDKTDKYVNMIEAFECDFSLAKENNTHYQISKLQAMIESRDEGLMKDINLLSELSFNLRHGKAKIVEVKND